MGWDGIHVDESWVMMAACKTISILLHLLTCIYIYTDGHLGKCKPTQKPNGLVS